MLVSVIIPYFNDELNINKSVSSALNQTYKNLEIIIVDDGSTKDNSAQLIKDLSSKHTNVVAVLQENTGMLGAWNAGFSACNPHSEIIAFLDADDQYDTKYLNKLVDTYKQLPNIDQTITALKYYGEKTGVSIKYKTSRMLGASGLMTRWKNHPQNSSIASSLSFRRKILEVIFNNSTHLWEDWRLEADSFLCIASSILGGNCYYISDPLIKYHIHGTNNTYQADINSDYIRDYKLHLRKQRATTHFSQYMGHERLTSYGLLKEFFTITNPTKRNVKRYVGAILQTSDSFGAKLRDILKARRHYKNTK